MPRSDYCEIVVILDRSGSMQGIARDMEGGFDRFIAEQKLVPGKCRVSLYQFDDTYEVVYEGRDLSDVPPCSLRPRGSTALLDAVGRTVMATGSRLSSMSEHERPGKVVVFIITDGRENASREYRSERVRELVEHQTQRYQWQFVYLGTSETTFRDAARLGVRAGQTYSYASSGVGGQAMFNTVAAANAAYRSSTVTMDWSVAAAPVMEAAGVIDNKIPETTIQVPPDGAIVTGQTNEP